MYANIEQLLVEDRARHLESSFHQNALENPDLAACLPPELAEEPSSHLILHVMQNENDISKHQYVCIKCNSSLPGIQKVKAHCQSKIFSNKYS